MTLALVTCSDYFTVFAREECSEVGSNASEYFCIDLAGHTLDFQMLVDLGSKVLVLGCKLEGCLLGRREVAAEEVSKFLWKLAILDEGEGVVGDVVSLEEEVGFEGSDFLEGLEVVNVLLELGAGCGDFVPGVDLEEGETEG